LTIFEYFGHEVHFWMFEIEFFRPSLTPLAWLSVTSVLYVYAVAQVINRLIPTMETIVPHATTGAAEGAAFLTLCAGFSLCLATMTMVITHLCYLCIRHRRTIG
ncbi:hypothetical protein QOU23_26400, partial [Pseudomonas aeruginosa]